ncbi:UNVERIFIED_CONTAM: hypothetical protein K2H54_022743, partial [Gekko kuhli]
MALERSLSNPATVALGKGHVCGLAEQRGNPVLGRHGQGYTPPLTGYPNPCWKDGNAALLSNYEVYKLLTDLKQQRWETGKSKQSSGQQNLNTIMYETLKYISKTPCKYQSPEIVTDFLLAVRNHKLTKSCDPRTDPCRGQNGEELGNGTFLHTEWQDVAHYIPRIQFSMKRMMKQLQVKVAKNQSK